MGMMREASKLGYRYSEIMVFGFFLLVQMLWLSQPWKALRCWTLMAQETAGCGTHSAVKYVRCSVY